LALYPIKSRFRRLKDANELLKELGRKYMNSPRNWRVYFSVSRSYPTLLVGNSENSWLIKFESLYRVNPPGLGIELSEPLRNDPGKYDFGLRPISKELVSKLATDGFNEGIIKGILKQDPVGSVNEGSYLIGPYYKTGLKFLSENQVRLERKLEKELSKLLSRKYPTNI